MKIISNENKAVSCQLIKAISVQLTAISLCVEVKIILCQNELTADRLMVV